MTNVGDVCDRLNAFAPKLLAADWDNTGLLLGNRSDPCTKILCCLTVTSPVVAEAIDGGCSLIVSHHPILFRGTKNLSSSSRDGALPYSLARNGIAVYSPHTSFDNCEGGINDFLADKLGLENVRPLRLKPPIGGEGRIGELSEATSLGTLAERLRLALNSRAMQSTPDPDRAIRRVAVACGAAGEFLPDAVGERADLFVTGEMRFHDMLTAMEFGIALLLPGHHDSERPAIEMLAGLLQKAFPEIEVRSSDREAIPVANV